jgi:hypothetical protein
MVKRAVVALLLAASAALAHAEEQRAQLDTHFSRDSDGLQEEYFYARLALDLLSLGPGSKQALLTGHETIRDPTGAIRFTGLGVEDEQTLSKTARIALKLKQRFGEDWSPTTGSANLTLDPGPRWHLEGGADTDAIDTVSAARRKLRVTTSAFSLDDRIGREWTIVGGALHQSVTDGNHRIGALLKLIYSPQAIDGLNLQVRARRIDAAFRGQGYFAPPRLTEVMGLAQYAQGLPGGQWHLTGLIGAGVQRVNDSDSQPIYRAELRVRGWFTSHVGLQGAAGCANTGGLNAAAAGAGYRYCFSDLSLIGSW